ncbi:hypothetical protein [Pedobacter paludis]|nr:hypothetical protein [Pedobacter paludis]
MNSLIHKPDEYSLPLVSTASSSQQWFSEIPIHYRWFQPTDIKASKS